MPTVLLCTGHLISRDYRCSSKLGRKDSSQRTLRSAISTWLWLGLIDGRTDWLTDRLPAWVKAKPFLRCWLNSCLQKDLLSCTERGSCPGWAMNTAHEDEEWQQIKVYGTIVNGPKTSWPGPPKGCAPFTAFFLAAKDYFRNGLIPLRERDGVHVRVRATDAANPFATLRPPPGIGNFDSQIARQIPILG